MGLTIRHIQDHGEANTTEQIHWAYPSRVLPCTKDAGTCAYLDAVYHMHDISMLYTFILWGVILGVLVVWGALRIRRADAAPGGRTGFSDDISGRAGISRRWLLPDAPMRWLFGRVSRVQVAVLAVLSGYLIMFSVVEITYRTWITPIKGSTLHNTRTGLAGFSDRIGALAYALTPFAVLLCQRESLLSTITGIPYQHFNFLHRWLGRIIFVQSFLHTLVWTLIEGRLYQPQPSVYKEFLVQRYIIFGIVAMLCITFLTVCSTQWAIRKTGYEFFKITHWLVAVLYVGACWGHWDKLWCWMVPSLALIIVDQLVRSLRTISVHGGEGKAFGLRAVQADMTVLNESDGTVLRLDLEHDGTTWRAGQHFYLTFPSISVWQSHPFTVASLPRDARGKHKHVYLIRVRGGITNELRALGDTTLPVILTGPYGNAHPKTDSQHVLAVAGGTGVSFALPVIQAAIDKRRGVLDFVWIVRHVENLLWLKREMEELTTLLDVAAGLRIKIFVTRDDALPREARDLRDRGAEIARAEKEGTNTIITIATSDHEPKVAAQIPTPASTPADISLEDLLALRHSRFSVEFLGDHHPSIAEIVADFHERAAEMGGDIEEIVGSGPEAMGSEIRAAVARTRGGDVVRCYWDSRR